MHAVTAMGIGTQQRTNEQHGRASGPHPAGQNGTHGQQAGIHAGRPYQGPLEAHPTGHSEEGKKQNDEGNILQQNGVQSFINGHIGAIDQETGDQEGQAPENGNLAEVVFPEMGDGQRHDSNGQQHAGKGDHPHGRQFGPRNMGHALSGKGHCGQQKGE